MDGQEHTQLLEKLAEIKQGLAVNTVKTTSIETSISEVKFELKDIRLSFVTHSEFEARFLLITKEVGDHERRIRILENFKSIIIGGLLVVNAVYLPVLIWLVIKQLGK